jgi:TonB family protein
MKLASPLTPRGTCYGAISLLVLSGCAGNPTRRATAELVGPSTASTPGRQVLPRALSTNSAPIYPAAMRVTSTPALVNVECVIDEKGRILMASVENSTNAAFNQPTLDAVRGWTFEPGTRDGIATAMRVTLPVEYVMER